MPRLLVRQAGVLRRVASINVTDDGSIRLSLVRAGMSPSGWTWSVDGGEQQQTLADRALEPKTKEITIHTSGRINYHFGPKTRRYVPCLLDLDVAIPIIVYVIPAIDRLDAIPSAADGDHIVDAPDEPTGRCWFEFSILPLLTPALNGEVMRLGVEGLYGLTCACGAGDSGFSRPNVPPEVFTTVIPGATLPGQAVAEEVAFLRFKRAMYRNDVQSAAEAAGAPVAKHEVEALVQRGPGLFPPNKEGVWTLITSVPMRIAPALEVEFEEGRYRADVVELRPGDTRLATVRVRFKVFDTVRNAYVKELVGIKSIMLDANL